MNRSVLPVAALCAAVLAIGASDALAGTYTFTNITGNNAGNAAAGEAQLSLASFAHANPLLVRFTLTNAAGGLASSVKQVFVDDNAGVLASLSGFNATPGVSFVSGSHGAQPGGANVDFSADHALGARASSPPPANGINPGETLDWVYTLAAGKTFADVEAALTSGLLRFGVHMIAFPNGGSEGFVNDVPPDSPPDLEIVPTPLAGAMGAAGLGLVIARRRR
jgi:MYXO-CTERM domain-containing protein